MLAVVLTSEGLDRLYESAAFLGAARARGEKGLLFLRGPGLKAYMDRRWPCPASVPENELMFQRQTPEEFLEELRRQGVRVYACSAWARIFKITTHRLSSRVDAVVGLNAFLSQARGGPLITF